MKEFLVAQVKKQLLKLALSGAVALCIVGFRVYQVMSEPEWDEAAVEATMEEGSEGADLASAGAGEDGEGQEEGVVKRLLSFSPSDRSDQARDGVAGHRTVPCYLDGRTQYMMESDCVTRGGSPQVR